jgi:predicted TIM-barrel fold metal-dependent hydrolase
MIDFHTHAFPDELAERAMGVLHAEAEGVVSYLDGKLSSLIASMDANGIEKSVLCCIATKSEQFDPIFKWCRQIVSDRIVPFPSIHPDDPDAVKRVYQVAQAGFKGIKMHPYYQSFFLDDPKLDRIWEAISELGLLLVTHSGYDIAFERIERASPKQTLTVLDKFPQLRLVATHFGGWQQWDEVERLLLGKKIYMETSWSLDYLGPQRAKNMLLTHPCEYLLFGTDSPWTDQGATIESYKKLGLPQELEEKFFIRNASGLIGR